jgi:hypothetical protein
MPTSRSKVKCRIFLSLDLHPNLSSNNNPNPNHTHNIAFQSKDNLPLASYHVVYRLRRWNPNLASGSLRPLCGLDTIILIPLRPRIVKVDPRPRPNPSLIVS